MKIIASNYTTGEILKMIRKHYNLSQTDFAAKINKSRDWQYTNEINKSKFYIDDFISLSKIFNFNIFIKSKKDNRSLNFNDYKSNEILKIIREWSGKTQKEFASSINKTAGWQQSNELCLTSYYINDLFSLANKNNFDIEIIFS